MRLDKYLKVSRIIKRRTVSKDIISFGQVMANGRVVKPAYDVKIGDNITLVLGNTKITIEVLSLNEKIKKDEASSLYKIIKEEKIEENI